MVYIMKMPQAGNTMEDGTIVRWAKAEGDSVEKGEILLEVETDKATIEVESTHGGTVRKILYPEGTTVPVHTVLAILGQQDEDISEALAEAEKENAALASARAELAPDVLASEKPAAAESQAGAATGAVTPILMPQVGNTMEEGTIVAWHVRPGDRIKQGDMIFDVETDKATVEVEAVDSGRLARITVQEGETIEVKQPVAYLAESDADVDAYLAGHAAPVAKPRTAAPVQAVAGGPAIPAEAPVTIRMKAGRVTASPAARRIARQRGVDLAAIGAGRGPGGRVLSTDVLQAPSGAAEPVVGGQPVRRRMSKMRRAIARNLLASKQTIPHFYMRLTIDAEPLYRLYQAEKAKYPCTLNDVIVLACARAIREFPAFRSRLDKDGIVEFPSANIGIAVGIEEGLVVPVLVAADQMTLRQLAAEARRIIEAARGGKIEGLGQGVFTLTNLGMFGIEEFSAIINPPEAAILAVGAIREEVIVSGGATRPGWVMTMTLSADHRVIDGLVAAKFLGRLKEVLEQPAQLA